MSTKTVKNPLVEVTWTSASIIKITSKKDILLAGVSIKSGETFFLSRSDSKPGFYHVVTWNEDRNTYQCSCGAGCKDHSHNRNVKTYMIARRKPASTPVQVPVVVSESKPVETSEQAEKRRRDTPLYSRPFPGLPKSYKQLEEEARAKKKSA